MGNKYYDDEGKKVIKVTMRSGGFSHNTSYGSPDAIWTHPETGGKVYVGCKTAASDLGILNAHKIRYVVNCQGMDAENYHGKNGEFTYLRFPIGVC